MLKRILINTGYLALMLGIGFAIYHYFLSSSGLNNQQLENTSRSEFSTLLTQSLFKANFQNVNGVNESLSQYKGKIIVLNFWATWCPPCREEMPELSELNSEYKNKNVVVIGVAIDDLSLVKNFSKLTPVSYPVYVAENDGMILAENLGNNKGVLPYTVIINQSGGVANTYFGRINKLLLITSLTPLLSH